MKIYYILFSIIIAVGITTINTNAQNTVAPYLCSDGLYGLANEDGQMVINCQYENINYTRGYNVFVARKNKEYQYYTPTGKLINQVPFKTYVNPTKGYIKNEKNELIDSANIITCRETDIYSIYSKVDPKRKILTGITRKTLNPFTNRKRLVRTPQLFGGAYAPMMDINGKMNIVDQNFKVILNEGHDYLTVIDDEIIGVYEANGIYVLNIQSQTKSKEYFEIINTTNRKGQYIVNSREYDSSPKEIKSIPKSFLIDSNGNPTNNLKYHLLLNTTCDVLVSRLDNDYNLIKYDGEKITKTPYERISYLGGQFFSAQKIDSTWIINKSGEKVAGPYDKIKIIRSGSTVYYSARIQDSTKILDAITLNTLTTVKAREIRGTTEDYIVTIHNGYQNYGINLMSLSKTKSGKKAKFIKTHFKTLFEVSTDSVFSVYDTKLNTIVTDLNGEWCENMRDTTVLLIKEKGELLYKYFDIQNKKYTKQTIADPSFAVSPKSAFKKLREKNKILLRNGEIKNIDNYKIKYELYKENTFIIVAENVLTKEFHLLNENFDNIIPAGFLIPNKYYTSDYIKNELFVVKKNTLSGIIDLNGQWVSGPNKNKHRIISPNAISEIVNGNGYGNNTILHTLNKGKWKPYNSEPTTLEVMTNHIISNTKYAGDKFYVESYALNEEREIVIPKSKGQLTIKGNHFVRCFGCNNERDKEKDLSIIYNMDGQEKIRIPYQVINIAKGYILANSDNTYYLLDSLGQLLFEKVTRSAKYIPEFKLYRDLVRNTPTLKMLNGENLHPEPIKRIARLEIDNSTYLIVVDAEKTTFYDQSLKPIAVKNRVLYKESGYMNRFTLFETPDEKKVYLSNKNLKLLAE